MLAEVRDARSDCEDVSVDGSLLLPSSSQLNCTTANGTLGWGLLATAEFSFCRALAACPCQSLP